MTDRRSTESDPLTNQPIVEDARKRHNTFTEKHPVLTATIVHCLRTVGILYIIFPIILFVFGGPILRELTYLNHLTLSKIWKNKCDVNQFYPRETYDSRNIDIPSSNGYEIPAWYIAPSENTKVPARFVIYSHGNAYSRCESYRLFGYKALIDEGYHVLTYDYGGFSNSTKKDVITDESLVQDLVDVVNYYENNLKPDDSTTLVLWGHSLGTGVTSAALDVFPEILNKTDVVVLEAPFSSFQEMVKGDSPLAALFIKIYGHMWIWMTDYLMEKHEVGKMFESRDHLNAIKQSDIPIIMAHAEDDFIIPYRNGKGLYDGTAGHLKSASFITIPGDEKIGHNKILSDKAYPIFEKLEEILQNS